MAPPTVAKFYEAKSRFTCINNPSIVLDIAQVNDGSCDCPDGSDEPGTAACSYLDPLSPPQPLPGSPSGTTNTTAALPGFWCENAGHVGAYVPFSYVNDGICDYELCCDGSEEYARKGGVKCANRCTAIGKAFRRAEEERQQGQERALKRRRVLTKEARQLRNEVTERIAKFRSEIVGLERTRDRLQKELTETERAERGKVVKTGGKGAKSGGKLGLLVNLAKQRVDELRETLDKVLDHRDDLQDKVEELETILRNFKEQYNPNFNDEGVKAAVHAWEDYAAKTADEKKPELQDADVHAVLKEDSEEGGVNWKEFETDDTTDTDVCKCAWLFPHFISVPFSNTLLQCTASRLICRRLCATTSTTSWGPSACGWSRAACWPTTATRPPSRRPLRMPAPRSRAPRTT